MIYDELARRLVELVMTVDHLPKDFLDKATRLIHAMFMLSCRCDDAFAQKNKPIYTKAFLCGTMHFELIHTVARKGIRSIFVSQKNTNQE